MESAANNPLLKPPLTFEEQLDLLISRGVMVYDREAAIKILRSVNYYRLTAYTLSLKENDVFKPGTKFDNIYDLYHFDQKLRSILIPMIETVEIAFRTHIAYFLAHKYGNTAHLDKSIFRNEMHYNEFREDLEKEYNRLHRSFYKSS
jgi:abortive infection bacteriophage resistance protein